MFSVDDLYNEKIPDYELLEYSGVIDPKRGRKNFKIPFEFNIETLDVFCHYVCTTNNLHISRAALQNIRNMLEVADLKRYMNNDSYNARFQFIAKCLEARLDNGLEKKSLIVDYANRHTVYKEITEKEIIPNVHDGNVSSYIIKYVNMMVYENLIHGYSYYYTDKVLRLLEEKDSGKFSRIYEFAEEFKSLMAEIQNDIRVADRHNKSTLTFDLSDDNFKTAIHDIVKKLKAPTNKWKTGSKYLNRMLNGGFESARTYLFLAITGGGKSIILLTVSLWIREFNHANTKDPTKKATVVYISQENSYEETVERVWNILVTPDDIRNYTATEVEELLRSKGGLNLETDNSINFCIKYYNDKEIGVADIYTIVEQLEEENKEVIAIVHDYIQRLKPSEKYSELRHELAANANELSVLSKTLNIPVISAAQLNRSASQTIENAIITNKKDCVRLLGKHNTGESWGMIQNVDAAIIVGKEIDDSDPQNIKEYMAFNKVKFRGKPAPDEILYFVHPFEEGNGISLVSDVNSKETKSRFSILEFAKPKFTSNGTMKHVPTQNDNVSDTTTSFFKSFSVSEFNTDSFSEASNNINAKLKEITVQIQENKTELDFMYKQIKQSKLSVDGKIFIPKSFTEIRDDGLVINTRTNNIIIPPRDKKIQD